MPFWNSFGSDKYIGYGVCSSGQTVLKEWIEIVICVQQHAVLAALEGNHTVVFLCAVQAKRIEITRTAKPSLLCSERDSISVLLPNGRLAQWASPQLPESQVTAAPLGEAAGECGAAHAGMKSLPGNAID